MSNLLNEAIVDAKALRTAALKNAETIVIEKYSDEVRNTLEQLLEQDDLLGDPLGAAAPEVGADAGAEMPAPEAAGAEMPAMDPAAAPMEEGAEPEEIAEEDIPLAATDDLGNLEGKNLNSFPATGEEVQLTLDLGALQESIEALRVEEEIDLNEIDLAALLDEDDDTSQTWQVQPSGDPSAEEEESDSQAMQRAGLEEDAAMGLASHLMGNRDEEDEDLEEGEAYKRAEDEENINELVDAIVEKLTVDMGADLSGWAGRSSEDQKWAMEKELAHRRSTDVEEELNTLKKAQEELVFENNQVNEQNNQYKQAVNELKESLQDVNLSNARLLYTNRILRNTSLNERQKQKIVEAISGAGSVMEARTIYETLQSTVEATPKRGPQSLSEAIGRRSAVIRATRQEAPSSDPISDRMKKLAGIK